MMGTGPWEIEFGLQMGIDMKSTPAIATVNPAYIYGVPAAESLRVDDLLDFTNHDIFPSSSSSSSVPADAAGHLLPPQELASAAAGFDASFPDDIYIHSEEAAQLEWLSRFVEDSFSDSPYHYAFAGEKTVPANINNFHGAEVSVAGCAARGKISHDLSASSSSSSSSSSGSSDFPKGKAGTGSRKKQGSSDCEARRCTHCASEKTPQWRTGPLGPKTLCNACGVRFKSGRLVPEYRPAASPTFVLTQHSNSHRKVVELRRQKEFLVHRHNNAGASSTESGGDGGDLLFQDYGVY
ncbi:GATA transcription factor 4 [Platanthera zijinensis]|uniref:GATA transcription factor 4 n=1 Tax=Platanthera zijinensis TaxID=2320716 RepID=A0AAP0C2X1_9ASPA